MDAAKPRGRLIPTTILNGEEWLLLNQIDKVLTIRANTIEIKKERVLDFDGHPVNEAKATGSVKCKPRKWSITL